MARVANAVEEAGTGATFQVARESNGWQYFVVHVAPARVSRDRIEAVITDAGGIVLRNPPLAATDGPRVTIWARVSNCVCAGDPYARIRRDLLAARANVDLELGPVTKDWLTLSATLDPRVTSPSNVSAILRKDGAEILAQPPPSAP